MLKNKPFEVKIRTLPNNQTVRPLTAAERIALERIMKATIEKMVVCQGGPHNGQIIVTRKQAKREVKFLTTLTCNEVLTEVYVTNNQLLRGVKG